MDTLVHSGHSHTSGLLLIALVVIGAVLAGALVTAAVRESRGSRRR